MAFLETNMVIVQSEDQGRNNLPERKGQSANESYAVFNCINRLTVANKWYICEDRPEAKLIVLAWSNGLRLK